MSFSPTGAADIESVIKQMLESYLKGLQISSSGGDSPKTNTVTSLPEISGFADVFDNAIRSSVLRHMEDNGLLGGVPGENVSSLSATAPPDTTSLLGTARSTVSASANPASIVSQGLSLLPHAALVSFAVSLIPILIEELTRPGGAFDLRFKRIIENEYNALQNRQTQFDIAIGERGTIFQARAGFLNTQGQSSNTNSLKLIREGGINKNFLTETDYVDHSKGFDI